jgi:hypothetical protein
MKIFIGGGVKTKPILKREWAFLFSKGSKRSRLMPAIASLEDLKSAQKEGVSIYAMLSALCAMLYALCDICWAVVTGACPRTIER